MVSCSSRQEVLLEQDNTFHHFTSKGHSASGKMSFLHLDPSAMNNFSGGAGSVAAPVTASSTMSSSSTSSFSFPSSNVQQTTAGKHGLLQPFDVVFDHQKQGSKGLCRNVEGNIHFIKMIVHYRERYLRSSYQDRKRIAQIIVNGVRLQGPPQGRFLERRASDGTLSVMSELQALARTFYFLEDNLNVPSSSSSSNATGATMRRPSSDADADGTSATVISTATSSSSSGGGGVFMGVNGSGSGSTDFMGNCSNNHIDFNSYQQQLNMSSTSNLCSPGSATSAASDLHQQSTSSMDVNEPLHYNNINIEPDPIPTFPTQTTTQAASNHHNNNFSSSMDTIMSCLEPTPIDESSLLMSKMKSNQIGFDVNGGSTSNANYLQTVSPTTSSAQTQGPILFKQRYRGPIDPFDRSFLNVDEWDLDMRALVEDDDDDDELKDEGQMNQTGNDSFNVADIQW